MIDVEKCSITHFPADVLAKNAEPVEKINDNIRLLVDKMVDIMFDLKGIGLAGPQVGVALRIFVVSLTGKRDDVKVYINPTVTTSGETESMEEGCLSVPKIWTKVLRYKQCTVTATGLDGKEFTDQAEGLYARCLQHEYDHICGITIANKMDQVSRIKNRKQLKKLADEYEKNSNA